MCPVPFCLMLAWFVAPAIGSRLNPTDVQKFVCQCAAATLCQLSVYATVGHGPTAPLAALALTPANRILQQFVGVIESELFLDA